MAFEPQPYVYASEVGSDPNSPPPSWLTSHKSLLIKGAVAIGVVLVAGAVVLFFVKRYQAKLAIEEGQTETVIKTATTDCLQAKDQAACEALAQTNLAKTQASLAYCLGLAGDDYDNCVTVVAIAVQDEAICKKVVDAKKKTACEQVISIVVAKEADTYEACDEIEDADLQAGCQQSWIASRLLAGECVTPPMSESECATANALKPALEAKDLALCDAIVNEDDHDLCVEVVGALQPKEAVEVVDTTTDSDGDGLADFDETNTWKTDPTKADTDGDGYDDGIEVKGGYNPLGAGKL